MIELKFPQGLYVVGLTGTIGSGKSTVAAILAAQGLPTIDTDAIARTRVRPGSVTWSKIVAHFGKNILLADQTLDRRQMAQIVFRDPAARKKLEAILHPVIWDEVLAQAEQYARHGEKIFIVEVPLLFETGMEKFFHEIVAVACSDECASQRLIKEKKWTPSEIEVRQTSQLTSQQKTQQADFVIDNEGDKGGLGERVASYLAGLYHRLPKGL